MRRLKMQGKPDAAEAAGIYIRMALGTKKNG